MTTRKIEGQGWCSRSVRQIGISGEWRGIEDDEAHASCRSCCHAWFSILNSIFTTFNACHICNVTILLYDILGSFCFRQIESWLRGSDNCYKTTLILFWSMNLINWGNQLRELINCTEVDDLGMKLAWIAGRSNLSASQRQEISKPCEYRFEKILHCAEPCRWAEGLVSYHGSDRNIGDVTCFWSLS